MAELADSPKKLQVAEEIEVEHVDTDDYFFCKVGDPVSLTSADPIFEADTVPSKPLAMSQRFGLIFTAHSSGFCVAKTKDVIDAAKEIKEKGSGATVQELSIVDADIGRVSILALSDDSAYVSAVVENEIHFFSVNSLLNKDQKPMFSSSVESNHVKDMLWIKGAEPSFVVLTDSGKLHRGAIHKPLTNVMDEIDAVEQSVDGQFLAIGRKNNVSILSSQLEEVFQIALSLDSFTGDNSAIDTIKVDSIRWVRSDSIVVGCLQQTVDGEEENYFLQVLMSEDGTVINDSSTLTAVQFNDLFPDIVDNIVPYGCGPHLFMSYLEKCEISFVSNRKNTDDHIKLFSWSQGDNSVSVIDIVRERWLPRIELQENGDDNLVLGLCVDEKSVYENVEVNVGVEEQRELRPHCLLVCLTLEGKLVMFNIASISGCQPSSQTLSTFSDNGQPTPVVSGSNFGEGLPQSEKKTTDTVLGSYELSTKNSNAPPNIPVAKDITSGKSESFDFTSSIDQNLRKTSVAENGQRVMGLNTSKPFGNFEQIRQETSNQFLMKDSHAQGGGIEKWTITSPAESSKKSLADTNRYTVVQTGSGVPHSISNPTGSSDVQGLSAASNAIPPFILQTSNSTKTNSSRTPFTSSNIANEVGSFSANVVPSSDSIASLVGKPANHSQNVTCSSGVSETAHGILNPEVQSRVGVTSQSSTSRGLMKGNHQNFSPFGQMKEQNSSKQFVNVENMAKELDKLLECIEETGGFRDSCTSVHKSSLEDLEEGMRSLSERSRIWQSVSEERCKDLELLLDKTVQVLARKTHMEGIVRQTTDEQYWELWDRQKLSSELDQKQLTVLNLSQDLVNKMIELEKHFNALELNLFGEGTGANVVSRTPHCRSPSASQSLNAIHNATVSQLAAAQHLSDSLSRQMTALSVKLPSTKQASVKKQVFEAIGIPCPDDNLTFPNTAKVFDTPANKHSLVSFSGATNNQFKKSQSSGRSSELETSRRRRDSLDRNWAKFEAPKTTVKRALVQNEQQDGYGLFNPVDKRSVSPYKLEGSMATRSEVLSVQDRNGGQDKYEKLNSDTTAFKWAGDIPGTSQRQVEQHTRSQAVQGNRFSSVQNISASSSPSPSSLSSFRVPDMARETSGMRAERSGTQVGSVGKPDAPLVDRRPSGLQWGAENPTIQRSQLQPPPSSTNFNQVLTTSSKEIEVTKPDDSSSSIKSTSKHDVQFSPAPPLGIFAGSSSSLPSLSVSASPIASLEGDRATTSKVSKEASKEVSKSTSSTFPVSSSLTSPAYPISFGVPATDSNVLVSSVSSAQDSLKTGPKPLADKVAVECNPATSSQSSQKLIPAADDTLKSEHLTPSASLIEVPKSFGNPSDVSKASTVASDASNALVEKQATTFNLAPVFSSDSGGPTDLKGTATVTSNVTANAPPEKQTAMFTPPTVFPSVSGATTGEVNSFGAAITQEDEMEEEAPEANQAAGFSLGSLAGFGLGSAVSATPTATSSNPFGPSLSSTPQITQSSTSFTVPQGQLFRPASFSFQSPVSQQSQSPNMGATSSAFGAATSPQQPPAASGFGQPGQIGFGGQQALGSVLGSFGQSRQIGAGLPGSGFGGVPSSGGFSNAAGGGGFAGGSAMTGGFASVSAKAGGFAGISTTGGGFAGFGNTGGGFAAAAPAGGGFAAAAPSGGGFAAAASGGGGFAAAAPSGGGFAGAGSGGGGFGAFSNQGTGGFSTGGQPPSPLFTQMRR